MVHDILAEVRARGDEALVEYTAAARPSPPFSTEDDWRFGPDEACRAAFEALEDRVHAMLSSSPPRASAPTMRRSCRSGRDYVDDTGARLGARWSPVEAAGLYVPGGRAAYPSSLLMNAIPAKVAGVERLVVATPTPQGHVNDLVLAAAHIAGVDEVWRVGGAQAIAALAYGTGRIARVDVVTGPGNAYVAEAKRQLYGVVGIDMVAGPSEILVISPTGNPIPTGSPPTCSARPSTTRPRNRSSSPTTRCSVSRWRTRSTCSCCACPPRTDRTRELGRARRDPHRHRPARGSARARQPPRRRACRAGGRRA